MKFVIVLVAIIALAAARPNSHVTLKSESNVEPEHYNFHVETSDGKSHHEEGTLKDAGTDHAGLVVHGSFTYKDEHDGHIYTVNYVADEHGFQPTGEHLPQLPKVV